MLLAMRYLELRRHTLRTDDHPHINQAGLDLARRIGVGMGPFHRVISSPSPRCIETAIAMGFAVDELYEPVQEELKRKHLHKLDDLLPANTSFVERAAVMQDEKAGRRYAEALVAQWTALARRIPAGKSFLVITHGGYIDDSAVACLPGTDHRKWGRNLSHCEGIRLAFDKGYFISGELLRVSKA
jgi:broad specificity phosphatase PhoE